MEDKKEPQKRKSLNESLAKLEESLFVAQQNGNTRQANAIRIMIKCLKNKKAFPKKG